MFCRKCGRQLRDGSVFCAYCGSRTVQSDGAPQTGSGYENAGNVHTNGPGNYAQQPGNGHFYQPGAPGSEQHNSYNSGGSYMSGPGYGAGPANQGFYPSGGAHMMGSGMQMAAVEFARNVVGLEDAHSNEFSTMTTNPVIHIMPDKEGITNLGGTLRLGAYPCNLVDNSKALELYGSKTIEERHRHRYEVNNKYREVLQEYGMLLSGFSPDGRIVEMIEIPDHPWFIGTQAHPEFKSRPNKPHPLFKGFLSAALDYQKKK